jgi:dihydroorotate dehydrogenase
MYQSVKKLLFCLSPEVAHTATVKALRLFNKTDIISRLMPKVPSVPCKVMGLEFKNPVGLAAGFDKNGDCINGASQLGFGFIELGTVTPLAQSGNPKPRLFRVTNQDSLINRLGFNNLGVANLLKNVKSSTYNGILGINIGKNFNTPTEKAVADYLYCIEHVYNHTDYLTINLSSPNTPNLRDLQYGDALKRLIEKLKQQQQQLTTLYNKYVPFAVKIAPDITEDNLKKIASIFLDNEVDAVIATNTTIDHSQVQDSKLQAEAGGLSGKLLHNMSTKTIQILATELGNKIPIIGVGGVTDAQTAKEKIEAGASLLQLYTGLIYKGTDLIKEVAESVYATKKIYPK